VIMNDLTLHTLISGLLVIPCLKQSMHTNPTEIHLLPPPMHLFHPISGISRHLTVYKPVHTTLLIKRQLATPISLPEKYLRMVQKSTSSKNIWVAASDGDLDRVKVSLRRHRIPHRLKRVSIRNMSGMIERGVELMGCRR